MSRFKRTLVHLTSEYSTVDLLDVCLREGARYVRHVSPPGDLVFDKSSEYILLKDRYPHDVNELFSHNVPILSLLPSNVFLTRGRNSLAKSLCAESGLAGSIFLIKSNAYSVVPIYIQTFDIDFSCLSLRQAFDLVFADLYAKLSDILVFDLVSKFFLEALPLSLDRAGYQESDVFREIDAINFADDIRFPLGLDTLCSDVRTLFFGS